MTGFPVKNYIRVVFIYERWQVEQRVSKKTADVSTEYFLMYCNANLIAMFCCIVRYIMWPLWEFL